MEQKPLKIKYGTIGFVYILCNFLINKYYPGLWELMTFVEDPNFGTALFFVLFAIAPIPILLACND